MPARWFVDIEEFARAVGSHSNYGSRQRQIEDHAGERGTSPRKVELDLAAFFIIDDLAADDPELAERCKSLAAQGVQAIGRWYRRDPLAARAAVMQEPPPSTRQFLEWERSTRKAPIELNPFEDLAMELRSGRLSFSRSETLQAIHQQCTGSPAPDAARLGWAAPDHPYFQACGIELIGEDGNGPQIGFLNAPRRSMGTVYGQIARTIWARAVQAATLCPIVVVVFTDSEALEATMRALPHPPSGQFGWPDWNTGQPSSGAGAKSVSVVWPGAPRGGLVVMTTIDALLTEFSI